MNYGRMKSLVRLSLGELTAANSYYTDAEVAAMINDSFIQVAADVPCNISFRDVTAVVGTQRYSLALDMLQLKDVQLFVTSTLKRQLMRLGFDEFESVSMSNATRQGQSAYFKYEPGATAVTGAAAGLPGDIWLYPVPDDATYVIRYYFYQKPSALTNDSDVTELPETLHWAVVYHATAMLALKNDDQNKHTIMMIQYDRAIARARRWLVKEDRTGIHGMQDVMGYSKTGLIRP